MTTTDEKLLTTWHRECAALATQKELVQDLHRQVQERQLGPYSPEAAVCHIEPEAAE